MGQRFEQNIRFVLRQVFLYVINKSILSILVSEFVWISLLANFALELLPVVADDLVVGFLALKLLEEPVFEAV